VRQGRFRATLAVIVLSIAVLAGCGGSHKATSVSGQSTAATDAEYSGGCPTHGNSRAFAKTRFALHAGLALGAFHRYIYKPLRNGGFSAGADKRIRTFAKAGVAGLFVTHELRVAKGFAVANPTLCNAVQSVSDRFTALTGRLRGNSATPADLDAGQSAFSSLQRTAGSAGFGFTEKTVTVPGAS
jgi:hypothetical protein